MTKKNKRHTVFLFGEAEKGDYCTPVLCKSLPQLIDMLGNPPEESEGIFYAIQALLYERDLIYFRVKEEGFSTQDYMRGLKILKKKEAFPELSAIALPGVGDTDILDAMQPVCHLYQSFLIVTQKDLYDFLMTPRPQL
jgi:hypothetical protein